MKTMTQKKKKRNREKKDNKSKMSNGVELSRYGFNAYVSFE